MASLRLLSVAALLALVLVVASAGAQATSLQQDASAATSGRDLLTVPTPVLDQVPNKVKLATLLALLSKSNQATQSKPKPALPKVPIKPLPMPLPIKPLPKANMPKVLPVEIPVPGPKDLVGMKLAGLKAVALANKKPQIPKIDIPQIEKPTIVPVLKPLPSLKDNSGLLQDALSLKKSVLMP